MFDESRYIKYFLMLLKMPRPSSTAATIDAKLSSVSVMAAASLTDVRSGDSHGDADVGLLERGRIVHAVAGHRHDVTSLLQRRDDTQLVGGRNAGINSTFFHRALEVRLAHRFQFAPGDYPARVEQAQFAGNRLRRHGMIAGDHDRLDAGLLTSLNRGPASGRGGSIIPTSPKKTMSRSHLPVSRLFVSDRQNAKRLARHLSRRLQHGLSVELGPASLRRSAVNWHAQDSRIISGAPLA